MINQGLEGIVAAQTKLSMVDGERGELIIAGFPVAELAANATFEETIWLLWHGELPSSEELEAFRSDLASRREVSGDALTILQGFAIDGVDPMDALRTAIACHPERAQRVEGPPPQARGGSLDSLRSLGMTPAPDIVAKFPTIVAAHWRLTHSLDPIPPRPDLGHAANYLYMLSGVVPDPERVRGLETYLNTVVDHGLNASTFTARVITSTGSDLVSAVVGAVGALKGPLHGGAPGPALDMVFEIGEASRAEAVLRKKIEAGEKLMGFGHRVYKVRDPRADVLAAAAERMFTRGGDMKLYTPALRLLEEYKPGRKLQTNVEFYTALLLHGLELEVPLFTPTFAVSRVAGWIAHCLEQRAANRIIRPQSEYIGPRGRTWRASQPAVRGQMPRSTAPDQTMA